MNLLSIENSFNLCSVAIKISNKIIYKEYKTKINSTKNIIYIIDSVLNNNNLSHKDLDCIILGDYPVSLTVEKSIMLIVQNFFIVWKIPVFRISSLFSICIESFLKFNYENIFVAIDNIDGFRYCFFNYHDGVISFNQYKRESLKEDFFSKKLINFLAVFNVNERNINISKNFLFIKKNIFPKAIYSSLIAEHLILNSNLFFKNKFKMIFSNKNLYTKFKY
jgi:tRNA A37 threonylcarbamoyladenosine modification protein TsaB